MARLRMGVLVVSTSPTVEPDYYSVLPVSSGISLHFERMYNGRWGNQPVRPEDEAYSGDVAEETKRDKSWTMLGSDLNMMNADVERAARSLGNVRPDVIAYACTAGTWLDGHLDFDRELAERITRASGGSPVVTAFASSLDALRFMGARKVSIASPYWNAPLHKRLKPLVEQAGFEVVSAEGTPYTQAASRPRDVDEQDPQAIMDFVTKVVTPETDAVFLPGTPWRTLEVAEAMEQKLNKTVITANQATIWNALRVLGRTTPIPGYGKLLRNIPAAAKVA